MTLHRFFVAPGAIQGGRVALPPDLAHQAARVLRLKAGDAVVVLDDSGREYRVVLDEVGPRRAEGAVAESRENLAEPRLRLTLYQALLPREKFETVLQKGTEVGIAAFVPLETARSLAGKSVATPERLERWRRIVREAAEQCERGRLPRLEAPRAFGDALAEAARRGPSLLAWERQAGGGLADVLGRLPGAGEVALFVGPEGGFTPDEVAAARAAGAETVRLGPRILRAETAGPIMAALVLYASGSLEGAP